MPELDLNEPLPDRAHDAIRAAVVQAITDLQANGGDIEAGFQMTDMLSQFISELIGQNTDLTAQISAANIRADASEIRAKTAYAAIDDLQARVAALEQLNPPGA